MTLPNVHFTSNTIGIDMGQSLIKIAHIEGTNLILSYIPTSPENILKVHEFIRLKKSTVVNFTGGRAFNSHDEFSKELDAKLINEFEAIGKGMEFLHDLTKKKELSSHLIVSIGTGTSITLKGEGWKHLGGSALGGGFFMGMARMFFDIHDYREAINLAERGDRFNIDLKVNDIYDLKDNRVNSLFREFTASTLGKANKENDKIEDILDSMINLIGESIGTIAYLMAIKENVSFISFCGGFLMKNKKLRRILTTICKMNKIKAIFLKNSAYSGAIGSLLS